MDVRPVRTNPWTAPRRRPKVEVDVLYDVWVNKPLKGRRLWEGLAVVRTVMGFANREAAAGLRQRCPVGRGLSQSVAHTLARQLREVDVKVHTHPAWDERVAVVYAADGGLEQHITAIYRAGLAVGVYHHPFGRRSGKWAIKGKVHTFESETDLHAFVEGQVGERRRAESELEAYDQLTARSPDLEATIAEARRDEAPRRVYADWLLERGDGRAERLVLAMDGRPAREHAAVMFGPAVDNVDEIEWDKGLVRRATFIYPPDLDVATMRWLFGSLPLKVMTEAAVSLDYIEALTAAWPPNLQSLTVTDTRAPPDVDSLMEVAGRARDLKLSLGDGLSTLPIRLAQTKTLAIDAYVEEDSSTAFWDALLRDASIPHLEALEIFVRTYDDGIEALRRTPAFLDVSFPRLQRLTLYNVVDMAALARSPLLRSVRQLRFNYHQLNDFSELTPHLVAHRPLFGDRRVELDGPHSDNAEPLLDAGYVILDA